MFHWVFADDIEESPGWQRLGDPSVQRRTKRFRSWRPGGRWHAGCDLVVPAGTPIRAICDGTVRHFRKFYSGTWELEVVHTHDGYEPFTVRYGEVLRPDRGGLERTAGEEVIGGEEIALVGSLNVGGHMLHLELYAGTKKWPSLSLPRNLIGDIDPDDYTEAQREKISAGHWHPDFERRDDLCNPSDFLQAIKRGDAPPVPTTWGSAALPAPAGAAAAPQTPGGPASGPPGTGAAARLPGAWPARGTEHCRTPRVTSMRDILLGLCEEDNSDLWPPPATWIRGPAE